MDYITGKSLRDYRLEIGLSLRAAAKLVGITVARLKKIEAAKRLAVRGLVQKLEDALNLKDMRI
jgi:transcriptional regulator with XRE-family HTH domain